MSWRKVKLGEVCLIEKGNIGILKAIPGEFPLVVTSEERKTHNEFQFDGEAVIIPLVSGTGHGHASIKRIHFQTGKFAVGSILCAVIPKDKSILSAEFLYRYLDLKKEDELVSRMKGMANVTLPMKEIAQIEIPLPPINEQVNFIEQFANLELHNEELSTELTYQEDLLKQLRQSFLREAMQGKLVKQDKKDGNAKELLQKVNAEKKKHLPPINEEEIPFPIPENWIWCRGDVVAIYIDPQPSHRTPPVSKDGVPYIAMSDIRKNGSLDFASARKVSLSVLEEHKNRYTLKVGDFIFGKIGTIGKPVLLPEPFNYTLCANVILIQPNRNIIDDKYLYYFLSSPIAERFLIEKKSTTSYPVFGMHKARNMLIPLPPFKEQKRIVKKLAEVMNLCEELKTTITNNQNYTDQLLQVALKDALQMKVFEPLIEAD